MKYLILFLISFSAFGNYVKISDAENKTVSKVYTSAKSCGSDCIRLPNGYNSSYHEVADELVNDYDKPIYSKTKTETCSGQVDCEAKQLPKLSGHDCEGSQVCLDSQCESEESVLIDAGYTEVYCSKITGYQQKLSGNKVVIENSSLKSAYEAQKATEEADRQAMEQALKAQDCGRRVKARLLVRNSPKGLNNGQKRQLATTYKDIDQLLTAGSLDSAREDILAVTADGTLVTEDDKTALVAELDSCKP